MLKIFIYLLCLSGIGMQVAVSQSIVPNTQMTPGSGTQNLHTMPAAYDSSFQFNFVRTFRPSRPLHYGSEVMDTSRKLKEVGISTQYMDGIGRIIQHVDKGLTPAGYDLVLPFEYDSMERMTYQYLSYVSNEKNGAVKLNPFNAQKSYETQFYNPTNDPSGESFFYGMTLYDPYPGGPVVKTMTPGNSWAGSGRGKSTSYEVNGDSEVRVWQIDTAIGAVPTSSKFYKKGQLHRIVSSDEQGHMAIEYKDKQDNTVMTKTQMTSTDKTSHTNWLCTYFVYDDLNNLRFVISPKAVQYIAAHSWNLNFDSAVSDNLCFRYDYDNRGRMIVRKVPNTGKVEMVYDAWDRMVMSRDSNLTYQGKWLVTQYDVFSRPTGIYLWSNTQSRSVHANAAADTVNYPTLSGTYVLLNQTYYDNYGWVAGSGSGLSSSLRTAEITSDFLSPSSSVAPYTDQFISSMTSGNPDTAKGLATGTKTLILGTSNYLFNLNLYDEKGRAIQTQSTNMTGGIDYQTTQYSFDNRVLATRYHASLPGLTPDSVVVMTKSLYDDAGRLIETRKKVNGQPEVSLSRNTYNELAQLQRKQLGQQLNGSTYSTNALDSLLFDYNILGWLSGINRSVATGSSNSSYFGMQLSYDYGFTVPGNGYFNGNIAGIRWRSIGDGKQFAYGFLYDTANRLLKADFTQNNGSWNTSAGLDFSAKMGDGANPSTAYDPNGNILFMSQKGWKLTGSTQIDSLVYNYSTNSNRLKNVIDGDNDSATKLGDFRTSALAPVQHKDTSTVDYTYDGNGNLIRDLNKDIDTTGPNPITYNFLNLPDTIRIKNKGRIVYTYDAAGNRLAKTVLQPALPSKSTLYIGGGVYQDNQLQYVFTEEGRLRYTKKYFVAGDSANKYFYDYFLRDHLGNTRVILTEQRDTAIYAATMEARFRAKEKALFYNIDSCSYAASSVPGGWPTDNTVPAPDDSVARVNGSLHPMGPAILLKVMGGDSVTIAVNYLFRSGGSATNQQSAFPNILASLANGLFGMTGGNHGALTDIGNAATSPVASSITSFMNTNDSTPSTKPKAYLNWMLLDNQFKYVANGGQSGALPVVTPDLLQPLPKQFKLLQSGYLYIWVSNETKGWDVFFNNLIINHYTGPLVEENHYYPFGLGMVGISDKALKPNYAENKYRYNGGSELQNKEFADGSGLELYETHFRSLDPQLGRWWQVDPETDNERHAISPYASMSNNPVLRLDYAGNSDGQCCKELWEKINNALAPARVWFSMTLSPQAVTRPYRGPGTDALVQAGGNTLNGTLNGFTWGGWSTNPAQDYFNVPTEVDPMQTFVGQMGAAFAPGGNPFLGHGPGLQLAPAEGGGAPSPVDFTPTLPASRVDASSTTPPPKKNVPNPKGRRGSDEHENTIISMRNWLEKQGFNEFVREANVDIPAGGYKSKRFVDLRAENSTTKEVRWIQVGVQNKNGTAVSREQKALQDLLRAIMPDVKLVFQGYKIR